jgi:hypothetical protein
LILLKKKKKKRRRRRSSHAYFSRVKSLSKIQALEEKIQTAKCEVM